MSSYKSGQVSAQLFAGGSNSKKNGLASLFAPKPKPAPVSKAQNTDKKTEQNGLVNLFAPNTAPNNQKKKKNKVRKDSANMSTENIAPNPSPKAPKKKQKTKTMQPNDENVPVSKQEVPAWTAPFVHETLVKEKSEKAKPSPKAGQKRKIDKAKDDDDDNDGFKRPRRDRVRDRADDNRTVFVGNCPLSADKKVLKNLFKEYGEIESVRFRCAPPADPNLPRRAIVITKNFHERCQNYVAYIVFKEEADAKKAVEKNGHLLDGLHLRVDISAMSKKHDKKRSIFVGNLPFDITEEGLWTHFEDCGDITNVRVVRDRQTSLGKGIGYVQFESKDSVSLALKLNKTKVEGREIRVMVCTNKEKEKPGMKSGKKAGKKDPAEKRIRPKIKPKKPLFAPSNSTTATFKAKLQMKKDKMIRKMKKKKETAKKIKKSEKLPTTALIVKPRPRPAKAKNAGNKGKKNVNKVSGQKGKKAFTKDKGLKGEVFKGKDKGQKGKGFKGKDKHSKRKS